MRSRIAALALTLATPAHAQRAALKPAMPIDA
jgi:hypothetical protein